MAGSGDIERVLEGIQEDKLIALALELVNLHAPTGKERLREKLTF